MGWVILFLLSFGNAITGTIFGFILQDYTRGTFHIAMAILFVVLMGKIEDAYTPR